MQVLGAMVDKFKEKKKNVVDALIEGIDAVMKVVSSHRNSSLCLQIQK